MKKLKNMAEILFGKVYYKLRQVGYYKLRQVLLQIATGITNCDDRYYKLRQYRM